VGDEFAGRKMKCPKCRTRIRHHPGGQIELLTVGAPPPPPAAGAVAVPPAEEKKGSTVAIPAVPEIVGKLVSQSESKQNTVVIGGVIGFLALALSAMGLAMEIKILTVAPLAIALAVAFVWLVLRSKQQKAAAIRAEKEKILKEALPVAKKDEGKTERLPKV
jgi:hypothetical protein